MKKKIAKKAVKKATKTKSLKPALKQAKPAKLAKTAAVAKKVATKVEDIREPKKLKLSKEAAEKFKKLLLDLRDHLIDGVSFLASENLKRTHRDASGELSGYSMHMADAGTDTFDREFALSLVSSEQEALYEIEEALKRLESSTYGLCDMCEKTVARERLEAVPFTRLCVNCQASIEKDRRGVARPVSSFTESTDDDDGETEEAEEKEK